MTHASHIVRIVRNVRLVRIVQRVRVVPFVLAMLVVAASASAQGVATGSIAGVVKDASGAVLPGVTVEASSPVLIEKSRTAVTDEQGAYKIVDLRPGMYSVTFTLAGFGTVRRDGGAMSNNFTAPLTVADKD